MWRHTHLLLLFAFIERYSPLSSTLTALTSGVYEEVHSKTINNHKYFLKTELSV